MTMNELPPLRSTCIHSTPVLVRGHDSLPPYMHRHSYITPSPKQSVIYTQIRWRHTHTHTHTHTHHMAECQTAARPGVTWERLVLQKTRMAVTASAHNSVTRPPPRVHILYVCTCVRVGAACQRASWLVILYVCPCVTQPCDRYWAVISVNQTKSSTCIFIVMLIPAEEP